MTAKNIIIGKNGQLGSALMNLLGDKAICFSHTDYDFSNITQIEKALNNIKIIAIFNAAAYTNVDKAESEYEEALKANAKIPEALAKFCQKNDIPLIHYSTDYVYSGEGTQSNKETDAPCPVNKYGQSKLEGEKYILSSGCNHLIFRTSWVYDANGKNFLTTMLRLGSEREELAIVGDQVGSPTYAPDLAQQSILAFNNVVNNKNFPSGIYNLCNDGETNWHEFAKMIFQLAKSFGIQLKIEDINEIKTSEYITPAKRPLNSRLDCSKAKSVLNIHMPKWQMSLAKCMEKVIENTNNTAKRPTGC